VGNGISLDPTSQTLLSPCDGEVIQLHSAGHALTLLTEQGVEIMLHIGLDTVALKGKGFHPRTRKGARVRTGDPLIDFDADVVATSATSLLTQIVIVNSDQVAEFRPRTGRVAAGIDTILELVMEERGSKAGGASLASAEARSEAIRVPNPNGLHARPVAVLAAAAKRFQSEIQLVHGKTKRSANAKSVVAVMTLEVGRGDEVSLTAQGTDAPEAVRTLTDLLHSGLGESEGRAPAPAPAPKAEKPVTRAVDADPNLLRGVPASPGLAVGNVFQVTHRELTFEENARDHQQERRKLDHALEQAKAQLDALQSWLQGQADASKAAIFAAHQEILSDPDLLSMVDHDLTQGKTAGFAWKKVIASHAAMLSGLKNELLAARANDVLDVGNRVLRLLAGEVEQRTIQPPLNAILIAEDLTPSDTAGLDRTRVLGFCTIAGGATSHVAILARSLGIPAIAGMDPRALDVAAGTPVILDGASGTLRSNPSTEEISRIHVLQEKHAVRKKDDVAHAMEPATTTDGHRVEVVANIGSAAEAERAVTLGGEGVGLLRSEFLFLERASAPDEQEQFQTYERVARILGPKRPLVIRTLDVGGDKPLAYLPLPKEDNPFLGVRGIRIGLDRPELLRTQVRAILRASAHGKVLIMFPMIATVNEVKDAKRVVLEEAKALGVPPIGIGIMVEVPSAAVLADRFAPHVDFFSIGTNDLTQYALAMDRGHPKLAPHVDGLDPAVLRLIDMTVKAAHEHGKWVGVCGGLASEPAAVPLLLGLGVDELSVSVPSIPAIKAQIRGLSRAKCRTVAQTALSKETASEVRALVAPLVAED
jgi:multiphosphoryl transfer protein